MVTRWALGGMAALLTVGCSGGGATEVSKDKDQQLRNSFSRALTPEEVARLKGAGGAGPAAVPPKKGP